MDLTDAKQFIFVLVAIVILWYANGGYERYLAMKNNTPVSQRSSQSAAIGEQGISSRSKAMVPGRMEERVYVLE